MSGFIITSLIILVFVIIYQIGKASEYAAVLRGEKKVNAQVNRAIAFMLLAIFVLGVWGIWVCHQYFQDKMLPVAACDTGVNYDSMFRVTIMVTGIVFFLTQAVLFWFCFKYQASEKRTTFFFAHSNKLELIWTTIPAIAMAVLVAIGLKNWMQVTSPAPAEATVIEIVGKQFNWLIRYPGADNELGKRDFRKINDANNVLGLDWTDPHNTDDIIAQNGEMHVVVGKPVKLIIGSRDVIHDVGLPHFRMKMDAVPGITTTLWFTPTITSDSMKLITKNPDFVYEIACDQLCGKGHYAMRGTIIVETQAQYNKWMASQPSYYAISNPQPAAPGADSTKALPVADSTKAISMK
ncbi:MAG: cytochrome c oxidase subunit II [Taibaiella sp.]|nr:cytochrome c oxidase subunit II [Taibaiella sp.]